jgi:hypothetical protein
MSITLLYASAVAPATKITLPYATVIAPPMAIIQTARHRNRIG